MDERDKGLRGGNLRVCSSLCTAATAEEIYHGAGMCLKPPGASIGPIVEVHGEEAELIF
jgi:hypothetical protein